MATIRSYTTIEQSKALAKILPLESADMCFNIANMIPLMVPYSRLDEFFDINPTPDFLIPCWSIAALLAIFPDHLYFGSERMQFGIDKMGSLYNAYYEAKHSFWQTRADNPVDACYGMVLKLKEKNLL